jgi:hypothetical protein
MFINQETNNRIRIATTNLPLRVSLHVLVAFAICRLLSVVIVGPTPITFCNQTFEVILRHVNGQSVGVAAKGPAPNATRAVIF